MGKIFETVLEFFRETGWNFNIAIDGKMIELNVGGNNGRWKCYADAKEEINAYVFYSICPINVPENKLSAMAELIARANFGLLFGSFELDFKDGEVRFKIVSDFCGISPTKGSIKKATLLNVMTMDRYLPGIMGVTYSDISAELAIMKIEKAASRETE